MRRASSLPPSLLPLEKQRRLAAHNRAMAEGRFVVLSDGSLVLYDHQPMEPGQWGIAMVKGRHRQMLGRAIERVYAL